MQDAAMKIKEINGVSMMQSLPFYKVQFIEEELPSTWLPIHLVPQHLIIDYYKNNQNTIRDESIFGPDDEANASNSLYEICSAESDAVINLLAKQFVTRRGLELPPCQKDQLMKRLSTLSECFPGESLVSQLMKEILIEKLRERRQELQLRLREVEFDINLRSDCTEAITVVNNVSCDGLPENFTFINENDVPKNIEMLAIGCECTECCCCSENCIHYDSDVKLAYTIDRRIKKPFIEPTKKNGDGEIKKRIVHECNKNCKCGPECRNRVAQQGCLVKLELYYSINGCGWGVRAAQNIVKNTFVFRYAGEVITACEVRKRGSKSLYIFDMDMEKPEGQEFGDFAIDGDRFGNLGRFVNHSCDPNLEVIGIHIDSSDSRLHEIAFFTIRDVEEGEQLCIDYGREYKIIQDCRCGSSHCRKDLTEMPKAKYLESSFNLSFNSTNPHSQSYSLNISE